VAWRGVTSVDATALSMALIAKIFRELKPRQRFGSIGSSRNGHPMKKPELALKAVTRDTLQERVYEQIRMALMEGRFKPGEPLRLQALADAVGTSMMPVREALRRLVAERALIGTGNQSIKVPCPTAAEFGDILELRLILEPYAAALAAQNLTSARLGDIEALSRKVDGSKSEADMLRNNQLFHFAIYRAAERPFLLSVIESLWLHIGPLLSNIVAREFEPGQRSEYGTLTMNHHASVMEGLRNKDPDATAAAIKADISDAGEEIKTILAQIEVADGAGQS
jgi:DNA-binding GntR family transcriptional regulator